MGWTSKILVRYILSCVCLWLSQFSQLSSMQFRGLCVFSLPISLMMIVRICVLHLIIIITPEVWPICHCSGLGHETVVCLSIFLWKRALYYWPLVRKIHWCPVGSAHTGPVNANVCGLFVVSLDNTSLCRWFQPWVPCDVIVIFLWSVINKSSYLVSLAAIFRPSVYEKS